MKEIKVIDKPQNISYEVIRNIIQQAHQVHFDRGIIMKTTTLSAQELEIRIGKTGKCFIAMDGDKVVGVGACRVKHLNSWFHQGEALEYKFDAIIPSYRGKRIFVMLNRKREEEARLRGINVICLDTPENNISVLQMHSKNDFKLVNFFASPSNHYSVEMVKWLDGCPFSKLYCTLRFYLKKIYTKLRFKPGRIKRFGI